MGTYGSTWHVGGFEARLDAWLTSLESRTYGSTSADYARVLAALRTFYHDRDPWELSTHDLETFCTRLRTRFKRKPSAYTMKREQIALRSFYGFCAKRYNASNPAADLQVVRIAPALPRPVDPRWVDRALKSERNPRWRAAILLAVDAGLRRGEIVRLLWDDTDLQRGWIAVDGKGGKERAIPLTPRLKAALGKLQPQSQHVICNAKGEAVHPMTVLDVVKYRFEQVGLPGVTVHRLRHTFGTSLFQVGVDARTAQELLGHASLATTAIYAFVSDDFKKDAIRKLGDASSS